MKIDGVKVSSKDIGKEVVYIPDHLLNRLDHPRGVPQKDISFGTIHHLNEHIEVVFVEYEEGIFPMGTQTKNLKWKETFDVKISVFG